MVGNAFVVMPFAMHLRLSFTNALPCGKKNSKKKKKTEVVHTLFALTVTPISSTPAQRESDV